MSSLKNRFLMSTVIVYLATAIIALAGLSWIAERIFVHLGTGFVEKQVLFNKARSIQPLLQEVNLARKMADSPLLRDWAENEADPDLRTRALLELESYRRFFRDGSYFFAVHKSGHYYFNDSAGTYTGQELRYTLSPDKPEDSWYYATVKSGTDYQLNVNPDVHLKVTKVWINVLLRDGDKVLGVLGTGIDLSRFIREVVQTGKRGINNVFIERHGAIQAHKDVSLIDFASLTKDAAERATIFDLIADPEDRNRLHAALERLADGASEVETQFLSVDGHRYLVGASFLKEIGWFSMVLQDPGTVIGRSQFVPIAILMAVALLIALVSTAVLLNQLVLMRVAKLDSSTRQVMAGDYAIDVQEGPRDEIGRLSRSFKRMADVLQEYTSNLEKLVEERTRELTESETRFRRLFEDSGDASLIIDGNHFVECNRATLDMLGLKSKEQVLHTHPSRLSPPTQPDGRPSDEKAEEMMAVAYENGSNRFEWVHRKADGTDFPVEVLLTPITQDERKLLHVVWRDITERKEAETRIDEVVAALRQSNADLEKFAYVSSHDLREPLRMVTSYLQLLDKKFASNIDDEAREYIDFAVNGAKRMDALIKDLLRYSRVESHGEDFRYLDSEEVLEEALDNLQSAIAESGAAIIFDGLPSVEADHSQLIQLFQNLVGNAIKYQSPNTMPEIRIAAEVSDSTVTFSVRDNGIGIDPDFFDRVFVIFQRLHGREEYSGTGVGLAVCKRIVERHGGRIWVQSEPGKGCTFFFTLPAA